MPLGIYRLSPPTETIHRGDVVEFCPPNWISPDRFPFYRRGRCSGGGEPMLKEVAAIAGDIVEVTNSGMFVNGGVIENSLPLDKQELPRLRGCFEVKDKEIWVFGSGASPELAQYSFDSRYFGAISTQRVTGVQAGSLDFRAREN